MTTAPFIAVDARSVLAERARRLPGARDRGAVILVGGEHYAALIGAPPPKRGWTSSDDDDDDDAVSPPPPPRPAVAAADDSDDDAKMQRYWDELDAAPSEMPSPASMPLDPSLYDPTRRPAVPAYWVLVFYMTRAPDADETARELYEIYELRTWRSFARAVFLVLPTTAYAFLEEGETRRELASTTRLSTTTWQLDALRHGDASELDDDNKVTAEVRAVRVMRLLAAYLARYGLAESDDREEFRDSLGHAIAANPPPASVSDEYKRAYAELAQEVAAAVR